MSELDTSNLAVGDTFYGVKDSNNFMQRKKILRVIDGEDWFKYDIPATTYKLITYEVLGILTKTLVGEWEYDSDYELKVELYVSSDSASPTPLRFTMYADEMDTYKYFLGKEEAVAYIETLYANDEEADRRDF